MFVGTFHVDAQINSAFSFQGIILDENGNPSANQMIEMTSSISSSFNSQDIVYTEVHDIFTNDKGLFDISIGSGIPIFGEFSEVDWLSYVPYIQLSYTLNDGAEDITLAWTKFKSVPFCFSSKYIVCSDGIDGEDGVQGAQGPQGDQGVQGNNGWEGQAGIDGIDGMPILPMLDTPPTTNIQEGSIYMDNGGNREDTLPGFRYYDGSDWLDL